MARKILFAAAAAIFAIPVLAQTGNQTQAAPDVSAMEQRMKEMEERIIQLEGKVRMLETTQASAPGAAPASAPSPTPAPAEVGASVAPSATPTYGGAGGSAAKALNPDISMIGDFIGSAGAGFASNRTHV